MKMKSRFSDSPNNMYIWHIILWNKINENSFFISQYWIPDVWFHDKKTLGCVFAFKQISCFKIYHECWKISLLSLSLFLFQFLSLTCFFLQMNLYRITCHILIKKYVKLVSKLFFALYLYRRNAIYNIK